MTALHFFLSSLCVHFNNICSIRKIFSHINFTSFIILISETCVWCRQVFPQSAVVVVFFINQLQSSRSEINLETGRGQTFYAIKNVLGQYPVWSNKDRAHSCSHFFFLSPSLSSSSFFFSSASPSVLHLSFPLCPSSPLLFITLLIKPAQPERTDFRGGWGRERDREGGRQREMGG